MRATISKLDFEEMKTKLKKIFGCGGDSDDLNIKIEDVNIADEEDVLYGQYGRFNKRPYRGGYQGSYGSSRGGYSRGYGRGKMMNEGSQYRHDYAKDKNFNKFDKRNLKMKCSFCQSICHQAFDCPDKIYFGTERDEEDEKDEIQDVVLYQSNLLTKEEYSTFIAECSVSAILDSGASATVAGESWFRSYYEGLNEKQQESVEYSDSKSTFKFGSGDKYPSLFKVKIPATVGSKEISICTDVVETDVPLLLSKEAMKKAGTEINFVNDTVTMFGEEQKVEVTRSGHYAIPLNDSKKVLKKIDAKANLKINLIAEQELMKDKEKTALKLHSQFAHPTKGKLLKLVERAGLGGDQDLREAIEKISSQCKICLEYRKPTPPPAVGLPHALEFNETVAMDLKFFKGHIILHLIDHLTRFSAAVICKSKEPRVIIDAIFKCWISVFGPPKKFLTDNGGEFANSYFLEMAESFGIRVVTTAAESPWSNGLVERHNATLAEMLYKTLEDKNISIETALAWAIQAKNSLANVHGFSPAQLAIGYNPQVPTVLTSQLPALEDRSTTDVISENLNAMRLAREAFIRAESSERIKRALKRNVRAGAHNKFFSGDLLFYKRNDSRKWKGPGRVIGSESSNVLIKHGAHYVRVHVCRVLLDKRESECWDNKKDEPLSPTVKPRQDLDKQEADEDTSDGYESEVIEQIVNRQGEYDLQDEVQNLEADTTENGESNDPKIWKKGAEIMFKLKDGPWDEGTIIRRTGKATGKYKDYWEVLCHSSGEKKEFNIVEDIDTWKLKNQQVGLALEIEEQEIFSVEKCLRSEIVDDVLKAKQLELEKWRKQDVFEEVEDVGQERLSVTWVITTKSGNNGIDTKARLVVRGYEEENEGIRSDSPTCLKENIRMLLAVAVAKGWSINTLDVKAAFLQGKSIDRDLFVTPPKEFREDRQLWKLKKVVYGLCDASRNWYLRVVEVLKNLGMKISRYDGAIFTFGKDELEGVMMIHVDDILFFGSKRFVREVIEPFKTKFQISREEERAFKYLGVELKQHDDHVILNQREYLESMKVELLSKDSMTDRDRYADKDEQKIFKRGIGQLGWITSISKPEGSFMYCALSTVQSRPKIEDFIKYRKIVRDLKSCDSSIKINKLDLETICLKVYSDASFGNLPDGGSQLGYVVFISDGNGVSVPITWASKKAKRVARSTLTAETLSAVEAVDVAVCSKTMLEEVLRMQLPAIKLYVDNKSLVETAHTSNVLADKRLLIDMAALREMIEKKELDLKWVRTDQQLADVLTKAGANKQKLVEALSTGSLPM